MEDGESVDFFFIVPEPILEYLSSFLRLNDAVNFRRTCKRHAELANSTVESKIHEEKRGHIFLWLKNPKNLWMQTMGKYGPAGDPRTAHKLMNTLGVCMNEGLDRAYTAGDLEAAEFFWERGADLSYHAYIHSIAHTNCRPFVEYPLDRGYQGSLDKIMHAAVFMTDVLLIRRCISLGAREFDITKYSKVDKTFKKARKCSKCGSPGHNKSTCK